MPATRFRMLFVLLLFTQLGCGLFAGRRYQGAVSDHFDGRRFHNPSGPKAKRLAQVIRWKLTADKGPWADWTESEPGPPPPRAVQNGQLRVTFINHATTLVQLDGVNILTDPIWSERASPLSWIGPKRVRAPGVRFEELPPIHAVVVSHDHYDHMDVPTLKRLSDTHRPRIFVPLGNAELLRDAGIANVQELDWWQAAQLGSVQVRAVPSQHFSARGVRDRDRTLWAGYVIESPSGNVYFAGDTAWGPHFAAIGARFPQLRLAILPIGAFRPRWFMESVHITPEEAVCAQRVLGAATAVGMHFGTFPLADDGQYEAPERVKKALAHGKHAPFWVLNFGEGRDVPPLVESR